MVLSASAPRVLSAPRVFRILVALVVVVVVVLSASAPRVFKMLVVAVAVISS